MAPWQHRTRLTMGLLMFAVSSCDAGSLREAREDHVADLRALDQDSTHDVMTGVTTDGRRAFLTRSSRDFGYTDVRTTTWSGAGWAPDSSLFPTLAGRIAGGRLGSGDTLIYVWSTRESVLGPAWDIAVSRRTNAWQPPVPLPAPINTPAMECCASGEQAGWLYFSSNRDGSWDVFRARHDGTGWGAPEKLPEGINTTADEWPGSVEANGRFLLFSSIRAGGAGADDIYIACASGDGWKAPVMLGDSINTAAFEDTPLI
ncbi:MAG: PD40 domain-containing protein, partial [Cytophagaceae bacterium]|nr:PD40 domain-containing protein [Gemmatimonadaceae bacterium]